MHSERRVGKGARGAFAHPTGLIFNPAFTKSKHPLR